jgi:RNA polymerase sigma-70 factor (ECF subfamily)
MWPRSDETQELLAGAGRGEAEAVDRLLERHRPALRQAVELRLDRKLSQRVDASDIVQDVLLEASRRIEDYLKRPPMPFALWLRQLAKDHMIDAHRRHRVAQRRSLDREQPLARPQLGDQSSLDLAGQLCDGELTPAAAAIRQELERRFLDALDQMSEDDREVILMRHFEHLSSEEAAQALGLTAAAAGMRHLRALRRLRAVLGEKPADGP